MKDYVRVFVYPQIRQWVPSSTREAAEALQKILKKQRELYRIDAEDVGLTSTLSDFLAGKLSFEEVSEKFKTAKRAQTLSISNQNIGNLENEIPNLIESAVMVRKAESSDSADAIFAPTPAIFRTEILTDKKLLVVDRRDPMLNNFQMFMAISDNAFRTEYPFFTVPHTTRIIWGGRRIIFIFSHPSGTFSLYYDIELFEDIGGNAGGGVFPTTTIITKKRIFIPIPSDIKTFLDLKNKETREFYVRFDTI
jgi:molecular chaperone HtpG